MVAHLSASLGAALSSGRSLIFAMLRVDLPGVNPPLCLLSGSGELTWDGQSFKGTDDRFGALSSFDPPEDGQSDDAPTMDFEIAAITDAAAATLAAASYQGARVRLWVSAIIDDAGSIADPYQLFDGVLDVPEISIDHNVRTLNFSCASGYELLFADTEGQRLADASHKFIWPGEAGFANVTGVNRQILWGPGDRPGGGSSTYGTGGGGGFNYQFESQKVLY